MRKTRTSACNRAFFDVSEDNVSNFILGGKPPDPQFLVHHHAREMFIKYARKRISTLNNGKCSLRLGLHTKRKFTLISRNLSASPPPPNSRQFTSLVVAFRSQSIKKSNVFLYMPFYVSPNGLRDTNLRTN